MDEVCQVLGEAFVVQSEWGQEWLGGPLGIWVSKAGLQSVSQFLDRGDQGVSASDLLKQVPNEARFNVRDLLDPARQ